MNVQPNGNGVDTTPGKTTTFRGGHGREVTLSIAPSISAYGAIDRAQCDSESPVDTSFSCRRKPIRYGCTDNGFSVSTEVC